MERPVSSLVSVQRHTKNFAVRQVFVNVQSKYHDHGNGTPVMDAIVVSTALSRQCLTPSNP
jgi:hypothetical protein